jgi:Leucine-rich repeat (LRR) protein
MSAAEVAYKAAEAAIEEAKRTGAETLDFSGEAFKALEIVPPGISALDRPRALDLGHTQVSNLAPLAGLTGLQDLRLNDTQVSDLAPLTGLTGLMTLSFDNTQVSDLTPLSGITWLQMLSLENTPVRDLAPLQRFTELRSLSFGRTQIGDLDPLRGLTGLKNLRLESTPVSDLAALQELTELQGLWFHNTQVNDLSPLQRLTGLLGLWFNSTKVTDLTPLATMRGLQYLSLRNTQVSDLSPLKGMAGLQTLQFGRTPVVDLAPLAGLKGLHDLWLDNTPVTNLAPLVGLTGLRTLSLDRTQVLDLRPLQGLQRLADDPTNSGLTFRDIPAAADPQIAEIANIEDDAKRAKALFALLEAGWVPPVASTLRNDKVDDPPPEPGSTPAFFFLSYASQDRPQIGTLRDFLAGQGVPVWWDQDIPAGAEWRRMIAGQLDAAKAVVTFWTQESVKRKAVIEEASHAQAAGRLLHVRLDDAPLPYGFGETQYVDLRDWDGTATHPQMAKLLRALRARLDSTGPVQIPPRQPAPVEIEVTDTLISMARKDGLPQRDANERAAMGWEALREYRKEFAATFSVSNYAPLPAYLYAFDRAMGEAYDPARVVMIGVQAQRFRALSRDAAFTATLPDGAAGDLRTFAAEMMVYLNRFPDWVAYRDDAEVIDPDGLRDVGDALTAIRDDLNATPEVTAEVKQEYAFEVAEALHANSTEIEAKAVFASTRELPRELAEHEARRRKQNRALAKKGGEFLDETIRPLGVPYFLALKLEEPLRELARKWPTRFGWIEDWYDATFGQDD